MRELQVGNVLVSRLSGSIIQVVKVVYEKRPYKAPLRAYHVRFICNRGDYTGDILKDSFTLPEKFFKVIADKKIEINVT